MKKLLTLLLLSLTLTLAACGNDKGELKAGADNKEGAQQNDDQPLVYVENQTIPGENFTSLAEHVDLLKELDEGTIIVRFNYTGSGIMSLFSLSEKEKNANHFHLYISPSAVGFENRYNGEHVHISAQFDYLKQSVDHTLALVVDQDEGYKFFLDGELLLSDTKTNVKFLSTIVEANSAQLGHTERADGNPYPFDGEIVFAEIYRKVFSDDELIQKTGETKMSEEASIPIPENVLITEPVNVFYPGFMDSQNYRIPSLLYTKKGTLIAGIDRRVSSGADSPNDIDAVIRRSFDEGDTWEEDGIYVNAYPDKRASNIDISLLQDETNERIFLLVDGFPAGAGLMGGNVKKGSGFTTIDGKRYMALTDQDGNEYIIREEGIVYDAEGNKTDYTVDRRRNLFLNGEQVSNIFSSDSPLKPFKTSYLELYYSDDEGETWTGPFELNGQVKEDWMSFLGTGPGNGIQIKEGEHAGRLIFPVYFFNDRNKQASAVIYSDDHGKTWKRGESPNEGRDISNGENFINEKDFSLSQFELTEAQVVEMPDGQLKMFMRNHSGRAQVATSLDGGETWLPIVETEEDLVAPYSQMTAIRYNGEIDGKPAVIFASASDPKARINGKVRIGLIEEDGTYENGRTKYKFDWKYEQLVKEGHYGYSSLTNLSDGNIGLFYEGTDNTVMDYIKFNVDFIKWDKE